MILNSLIPMFLIVTTIEAVIKNRYAVREYNPVELDCNHKLNNVTRARWEYISAYEIKSEIIYDNRSPQKLRTGFEVSCEPHETFISTCILKLNQPRKEDSGIYVCYVGTEIEAMNDFNLKIVNEIELVIRGPKYHTMVVSNGDSVILPCEHNIKNLTRARWSHVSLQGVMTYNLFYLNGIPTTHDNYEGLCKRYQLSCNLKILQANKESAGRYICMVGESLEFEEKYGLDQMTYFIEIQLVVGELLCNENMNKDLTLIGENDCYGIEADVLNLKCSFNYFGNINYHLLHLRWIEKYKFNSLENKLRSSLIKHEMKDETNKISIQTNLSVAYEMQNSIFQCVLDDTLVKPCQLQEFKTQYVKNTTSRSPIHSNDLRNIKCSANKSENVQCSYYRVHEIAEELVHYPQEKKIPLKNMASPDIYTCIAKCHLGGHKACTIKAMEFEIVHESPVESLAGSYLSLPSLKIGIILVFIATILILATITILLHLETKSSMRLPFHQFHQYRLF